MSDQLLARPGSSNTFYNELDSIMNRKAAPEPPPKRGIAEDIVTHLAIGANKYAALPAAGVAEMTGKALGITSLENAGKAFGDNAESWIARKEQENPSQKFRDISSVGDAGRWAGEQMLEFAPQAVIGIATGGAGAAAGRVAAGGMARAGIASLEGIAGKKAVQAAVANTGRNLTANELGILAAQRAGTAGAIAATGIGSIGMESSTIYRDQKPEEKDMGRALAYGTAAGILDTAFPAYLMKKTGLTKIMPGMGKVSGEAEALTGKTALTGIQRIKDTAKVAGLGIGEETIQEGVQTVLENIGSNKQVYSDEVNKAGGNFSAFLKVAADKGISAAVHPEAWNDIVESMAAGGLIGGVMGGGSSAIGHASDAMQQRAQQPQPSQEDTNASNQQTSAANVPGANATTRGILQDSSSAAADAIPETWPVDTGRAAGITNLPPTGALSRAVNSILPATSPVSADMYTSFAANPYGAAHEQQPTVPELPTGPTEIERAMAWKNQQVQAGQTHLMQGNRTSDANYAANILDLYRKAQESANGITNSVSALQNKTNMDGLGVPVPEVQSKVLRQGSDISQSGGLTNDLSNVQKEVNGPQTQVPNVRGETVGALQQEKAQLLANSGKGITGGLLHAPEVTQRLNEINAEIRRLEQTPVDANKKGSAPSIMVQKSLELQKTLKDAGFVKGSGVSKEGQQLVSRLAKENKLRNWSDTRDEADYNALIAATKQHLSNNRPAAPAATKNTQVNPAKPANTRRQLDTSKDSLIVAIAKMGGISRSDINSQSGNAKDLAHILNSMATKEAKAGILYVISSKGKPLDRMREALVEQGYLQENDDINTLLDKLDSASRGTVHYSTEASDKAGVAAYDEAMNRLLDMVDDMTDAEYAEFSQNQWFEEQAGLLAEVADDIDEYLQELDDASMTAADWQRIEDDLREALDATEFSAGSSTEDQGQVQKNATGQKESVHEVSEIAPESESSAGKRASVKKPTEKQPSLITTPPTFEKKPQPKTTKSDVSTGNLLDNFTSTESVQPALADVQPADTETKTGKITDFGEKIGGARKDFAAKFADAKNLDVATEPFAKSWPEPDYSKMEQQGFSKEDVALVRALRDEVPDKPRKSWKVKQWVDLVRTLRGHAEELLNGDSTVMRSVMERTKYDNLTFNNILGRAELYEAVGHGISLRGVTLQRNHWTVYHGKENVWLWQVERKQKATAFDNMPQMLGEGGTKEQAIADFQSKLDTFQPETKGKKATTFIVYSRKGTDGFIIGKKFGTDHVDIKTFPTAKEAHTYIKENHADLEKLLAEMKDLPSSRRATNNPRLGKDYRSDKDVTPEMFSQAFGFRGVEFGNYVQGSKRQQDLNNAYDALHDLAGLLNIPTQAISLDGELGLAFGARGHGGKDAAAAHYEPSRIVINLTKNSGAGSLAHEWFHAMDSYFSRKRGYKDEYITNKPIKYGQQDETRQELVDAFREVGKVLDATNLKGRSRELDKTRSQAYWSTGIEMHARAFENYVIDKLTDSGISNDYLANISDTGQYSEALLQGFTSGKTVNDLYPYLLDTEKAAVVAAFDKLFATIKTKETDKGVMLFDAAEDYGILDGDGIIVSGVAEAKNVQLDLFGNGGEAAAGRNKNRKVVGTSGRRGSDVQWFTSASFPGLRSDLKNELGFYQSGTFTSTHNTVKTPAQAASFFARIADNSKEELVMLALDNKNRPIAITSVSTGTLNQSLVHPLQVIGQTLNIPGAAKIWLAHNHPTGDITHSSADTNIAVRLTDAASGSGLSVAGFMTIGENGEYLALDNSRGLPEFGADKKNIPITDSKIIRRPDSAALRVIQPSMIADARDAAGLTGKTGIILLDGKNRVVASLEMSLADMSVLRTGNNNSGSGLLMKLAGKTNAAAMLVVTDATVRQSYDAIQNVASFGSIFGVNLLDASTSYATSLVEQRRMPDARNTFYSHAVNRKTGTTKATIEKAIAAAAKLSKVPLDVYQSLVDIPDYIREDLLAKGKVADAFFDHQTGHIGIIADYVADTARVQELLRHEWFHAGVADKELNALYTYFSQKDKAGLEAIATNRGFNLETEDGRLNTAGEYAAGLAERNPKHVLVQRIIARVKEWLQALGIETKFGAAEVSAIIHDAITAAKSGRGRGMASAMSSQDRSKAFYSKLAQTAEQAFPESMKVQSLENFLLKQGVKKEEMNAVGLREWLADKKPTDKVSRQELLDFVQANSVELKDVVLGASYKVRLTGGQRESFNSREAAEQRIKEEHEWIDDDSVNIYDYDDEILVTIYEGDLIVAYNLNKETDQWEKTFHGQPFDEQQDETFDDYEAALTDAEDEAEKIRDEWREEVTDEPELDDGGARFSQYTEPGAIDGSYREMFITAPMNNSKLPNATDADVLRDLDDEHRAQYVKKHNIAASWQDGHSQYPRIQNPVVRIRFNDREVDGKNILFVEEIQGPSDANQAKMPAYLKDNIYNLGVKRVLAYAKEQGYDGVSWTTGEMQAKRYDLSKHIENIGYQKRGDNYSVTVWDKSDKQIWQNQSATPTEVEEMLGKEILKKMEAGEGNAPVPGQNLPTYLTGLDLEVGGEGLKRLYDNDLGNLFKAYGKEIIQKTDMEVKQGPDTRPRPGIIVPYIPITDKTPGQFAQYSIIGEDTAQSKQQESAPNIDDLARSIAGSEGNFALAPDENSDTLEAGGHTNARHNGNGTGFSQQSKGYGKWETVLYTDGISESEILSGNDAYAAKGEASPHFKSWSNDYPVISIELLAKIDPETLVGKPAIFKVWSAQDNKLNHWDIDAALSNPFASGKNTSGAMWGVSKEAAQEHRGDDKEKSVNQYYFRAENPFYINGNKLNHKQVQQELIDARDAGYDVVILDGLGSGRAVLHLDAHFNPAVKRVDNIGTFSNSTSNHLFKLGDTTKGIPSAPAQAWVATLPISAHVNVVQSISQLPSDAQAVIIKAGVNPARVQAMELNGTIHVIIDNVPDMQRVKALVIGHELAHAGQQEKIVDLAVDWFKRTKNGKTEQAIEAQALLQKVANRYGFDLENEQQFRRAVKEATAAIAEQVADGTLKPVGLMQRLFMYIKHWLRKTGLIDHVSDNELTLAVAEMLRLGEKRLSTGRGGSEAALAQKETNSYPYAKAEIGGLTILDSIPNQNSIAATFSNYRILDGIREVPFSDFSGIDAVTPYIKNLAEQIDESGEIKPLIVAIDSEGPYILEGAHRYDALQYLGKKSFPAKIVLDLDPPSQFALADNAIIQHAKRIGAQGTVTSMTKSLMELVGMSIPPRLKANIGKIMSNPWFGSEGKPIRRHVVNLNLERGQNRNSIMSDLFQASEGYTGVEGLDNMLKKASKEEIKQFNDLIKYGDLNNVGKTFTRDELYRGKTEFGKVGKTVVEAYKAFHEIMQAANRVRFQQLDELSMLPYKDQEWFADLVELLNKNQERSAGLSPTEAGEFHRLVRSLKRGLTDEDLTSGENPAKIKASAAVIAAYHDFWRQVDQTDKKHQGNMLSAFRDILGYKGELDKLKNEWGNLKGYAPRNRKDGDYHVSVFTTNEEGERVKVYMHPTLTEAGAQSDVAKIKANLPKYLKGNFSEGAQYEVEYERNSATPSELLAWKGSEVAVEALLNQAFDRAGVTGKMSVEQWQSLKHEVFQEIAKEIMAQGFGRHGISREATLIEGYEDTDYQTVIKEYISGMAGWLSKMRFAIETTSAAKDLSKADPGDKVWVNDYVHDAMKNSTYMDELAATARSVGAVYYLGFKVSSAMLNAFQNYTVGQAELTRVMKKAGLKGSAIIMLAKAQKDVMQDYIDRKRGGKGTLTQEEHDILFKAVREGTAQAQAVRMISGSQEMGFGTGWKKFTELSMTPFQFVEQRLNREPGILAAYRVFKTTAAGKFDAAAYKQAEEFVNNTHYVMGKENLPEIVRKLGPLGKTAYLFQGYVHNYLHWMFNRAKNGEFEAIARSLGAVAALGGVFALPGADDLDKWIMKWFGVSYKMKVKKFVREAAGNSAPGQILQNFVNHGVTSVAGVDMTRALAVNIPFISDPDKSFGDRIGGAWGGLLKKPGMALGALQKGDGLRAIENIVPEFAANPMRALRQYNQGATSMSGKPIFDENGQQVRYGAADVAKKMLGFNPLDVSERTEMKGDERELNSYWKDERADMLANIRRAKTTEDMKAAVQDVRAFNLKLRKSLAFGLVAPISADSIQKSRTFKPQKKTLTWEKNQIE